MIIQDLLLYNSSYDHDRMMNILFLSFSSLASLIFTISALVEFVTGQDWEGLLKRTFFAILLATQFNTLVKVTVPYAMQIGSHVVDSVAKDNRFLLAMKEEEDERENQDSSINQLSGKLSLLMGSIKSSFAIGASFFFVKLVGVLYSFFYSLILSLGSALCIISIFQMTSTALTAVIATWVWLLLTPIIMGVVASICQGYAYEYAFKDDCSTATSQFHLLCYSILIFFVPMISSAFISYKGVHNVSDTFQQVASGAVVAKFISGSSTSMIRDTTKAAVSGYFEKDKEGNLKKMNGVMSKVVTTPLGAGLYMGAKGAGAIYSTGKSTIRSLSSKLNGPNSLQSNNSKVSSSNLQSASLGSNSSSSTAVSNSTSRPTQNNSNPLTMSGGDGSPSKSMTTNVSSRAESINNQSRSQSNNRERIVNNRPASTRLSDKQLNKNTRPISNDNNPFDNNIT